MGSVNVGMPVLAKVRVHNRLVPSVFEVQMHWSKSIGRAAQPRTLSGPGSCTRAALEMTKAKRAAAQEGVSAFEVELAQRQASVFFFFAHAPQDKDPLSRRCAKDRLPCLENRRLFLGLEPFLRGFHLLISYFPLNISSEHDSRLAARIFIL